LTGLLLCGAQHAQPVPAFSDFQGRFRDALARQDAAALAALTHLPFRFEGRLHGHEAFVQQVWPRLFSASVRRCLAQAPALTEGAGGTERVMFCRPYSFHFDASDGAWRLREFAADGEDAG
jgi:hypothetical protein